MKMPHLYTESFLKNSQVKTTDKVRYTPSPTSSRIIDNSLNDVTDDVDVDLFIVGDLLPSSLTGSTPQNQDPSTSPFQSFTNFSNRSVSGDDGFIDFFMQIFSDKIGRGLFGADVHTTGEIVNVCERGSGRF